MSEELDYRREEWLRERYINRERSTYEIAEAADVDSSTIHHWLKVHDIPAEDNDDRTDGYPRYRDERWMREQYIEQRRTVRQIAAETNTHHTTISRWLRKHDIQTRGATAESDETTCPMSGCRESVPFRDLRDHIDDVHDGGREPEAAPVDGGEGGRRWL
jgi:DNA-binding transcriptional ArsR family regulator